MIDAIKHNLELGARLLGTINDAQYSDTSVEPYHSSIGGHMRHILDIFDCIFDGLESGHIDLSARKRELEIEKSTKAGLARIERTLSRLSDLEQADMERLIYVSDDLGLGMVTARYTLAAALIQAHSHAIHHFASLGYILSKLGINMPKADFGYNPTTPRIVA